MRLTELIGARVVTGDGRRVGRVHDVLLVQDGPVVGGADARFRVHGLAVGRRSIGIRLGAVPDHDGDDSRVFRLLGRATRIVPWEVVTEVRDGTVTLADDHVR